MSDEMNQESNNDSSIIPSGEILDFDQVEALTTNMKATDRKVEKALAKDRPEGDDEKEERVQKREKVEKSDKTEVASQEGEPVQKVYEFVDANGKKIAVNDQLKFKHKVDGKPVEVSIKDLVENYSGKIPWNKKYDALDKERKAFHNERDQFVSERDGVNQTINEMVELSNTGKPIEALTLLGKAMGVNPAEFIKNLVGQVRKAAPKMFEGITPEDQERFDKDLTLQVYNARDSFEARDSKANEETATLKRFISEECEKHNLPQDEFNAAYRDLVINGAEKITAETTLDHALNKRAEKQATDALVLADVPDEKITPKLLQAMSKHIRSGLEVQDVVEATLSILGIKKTEKKSSLAKKVMADEDRTVGKKHQPAREAFSFDDID